MPQSSDDRSDRTGVRAGRESYRTYITRTGQKFNGLGHKIPLFLVTPFQDRTPTPRGPVTRLWNLW